MLVMPGGALETEDDTNFNPSSSSPTSTFVGNKLDDHRGAFILDYPMERGCVLDGSWADMETIWNVSFIYMYLQYRMG